ncbi:MAG: translocation/assembly module TamB domain-containing protein [Candidatus Tectimicrobiota bacterium]
MKRKFQRLAGYVAVALGCVSVLLYLARDPVRDGLGRLGAMWLSQALEGTLTVGSLRGSLFASLVLRDVRLRDRQGATVVHLAEMRVDYDILALLRQRLHIHALDLVRPVVHLVQDAQGTWNLARLFAASAAPSATPVSSLLATLDIRRVQIRAGTLLLHSPAWPGVQQIEDVHLRLQARADAQGTQLSVEQATARAHPAEVLLQGLEGSVARSADGTLRLADFRLQTAGTLITGAGVLPGGPQSADVTLAAQPFEMAELGRLLQRADLYGPVQLTLLAQGPPQGLRMQAQLQAAEGQLSLTGAADLHARPWRYEAQLAVRQANLASLLHQEAWQSDLNFQLHMAGEGVSPATFQGYLQFDAQPSYLGSLRLQPSQLLLTVAEGRVHVQRCALHTSAGHVQATGTLDLAGSSDLHYDLTAQLASLQPLLGSPGLDGTLQVQGHVRGAGAALHTQGAVALQRLRYDDLSLGSAQLHYEGSQLGTHPRITATLTAQHGRAFGLSVERLALDSVYDHAARQLQVTADLRQSAVATARGHGTWHWSEAGQQVLLQDLVLHLAERAWRLEAPAAFTYGADGLQLTGLALTHAQERLELTGSAASPAAQDIHLRLVQFDLTFLQRLFSLPEFIQGRASLQARLHGSAASPLLEAEGAWHPEASRRAPFDQAHLRLGYAQRQLHSDIRLRQGTREFLRLEARLPLDLSLQALPLAQRLPQEAVALQLRAQQAELSALSRWQPGWPALSGTLDADLTVQGTYATLELEAAVRLKQCALQDVLQQLNAPLQLQATLTLPGLQEEPAAPGLALVRPHLRKAVLRLPTLRAQLVGQAQSTHTVQIQNLVAQASGQWTAAGLEGRLETLQAQVRLAAFPRAELALAAHWQGQQLELSRVHLRWPFSEIRASGLLTWPQPQLQVRLDIPRLRLDELGMAPPSPLPALVQGVIDVHGSAVAPQVETRLQYAGGQLSASFKVDGREAPLRYKAQLRLDDLDAAALLPGAQGKLRLALQGQGAGLTEPDRRAEFEARLDTSQLSLAPGLSARLKGSLNGTTVRLAEGSVRSSVATLQASGTLAASPGDKTALTYELTLKDLRPLQAYLGTAVHAQGEVSGTLQGTWPALQVRSRLRLREWAYAALRGQRAQADLVLSQVPRAPQGTLKAQAVDVQGPQLPASALDLQSTYMASQGTAQLRVTAGPYEKTVLEGGVSLTAEQRLTITRIHVRHNGDTWDNATPLTVVRRGERRLEVPQFLLRSGRQELSAQGILTTDGAIDAQVQLRQVQLRPHIQLLAPHLAALEGQLALQLGLHGNLAQPQLEGQIALTGLRWQQQASGEVRGHFHTVGSVLQLEARWQAARGQSLEVAGTVALAAPYALMLHVRAMEVDLALAQYLSTAVSQSSGRLHLDVHMSGTPRAPALHGALTLQDGTVQLAATGARYTGLQAQLDFAGTRLELRRLHAESGHGVLDISGWATLRGLQLTRLEALLRAEEFALLHTPEVEATLSASVALRGSPDDLDATGILSLSRVRAQLGGKLMGGPEAVQPAQLSVESVYGSGPGPGRVQEHSAEPRQSALLHFLRADLRLELPQNAWVRSAGTAIELRGALAVTKELGKPFVLAGSVETVRGFASFYSGKFTIERGRIDFTGTPDINPVLDVVATREVSGHVVSVNVAGRAKTPQLHLSSTPELQQADIVTLLVLGKTTDRLTTAERSGLSSHAQQIVGNVAAGELEQLLAKPLGFDTVDIQTGESLGSSKVSVGRYVTQNLFLSYEQQLGGEESSNKVGVEYSVNRHLKLKGSSTNKGAAALDLLWRIDY